LLTSSSEGTSVKALPVHSTGDLLWAYMTLPEGQASHYPTMPEKTMPEILDCPKWTVRDLPYSFDFFIENFMDPAHIPFAHHSLQASREDGSPLPMTLLTSYDNATHLELGFKDVIKGKTGDGVVSFAAPCFYHFRTRNNVTNLWTKNLIAVVSPISPGKCRLFLELPPLRKLRGKFPTWFLHTLSNRFLDSDIWIHDQERVQRSGDNFYSEKKIMDPEAVSQTGKKYVMKTELGLQLELGLQ
jgi:phenylpropionate dioxygenase-like ring-hydroxylating dioxygenase large terminal subunit